MDPPLLHSIHQQWGGAIRAHFDMAQVGRPIAETIASAEAKWDSARGPGKDIPRPSHFSAMQRDQLFDPVVAIPSMK